jgi:phosphopantetheine adenylyltransferase
MIQNVYIRNLLKEFLGYKARLVTLDELQEKIVLVAQSDESLKREEVEKLLSLENLLEEIKFTVNEKDIFDAVVVKIQNQEEFLYKKYSNEMSDN